MTRENWPRTRGESEAYQKRWKRAVKLLGTCGYTPSASRTLANIFCDLADDDGRRKAEVLNAVTRITMET